MSPPGPPYITKQHIAIADWDTIRPGASVYKPTSEMHHWEIEQEDLQAEMYNRTSNLFHKDSMQEQEAATTVRVWREDSYRWRWLDEIYKK